MTFEKNRMASLQPLAVALLLSVQVRLALRLFRRSGEGVVFHGC